MSTAIAYQKIEDNQKNCGNCEYWDRKNKFTSKLAGFSWANCLYELPLLPSSISTEKSPPSPEHGAECPVFLRIKS